ncbi:unnamed protein product [Amoebophrya sp. A25]|nr:unnamed protein product [Amoebophrya sp. A25]|eukprot:GSA25T00008613001.1
MRCYCAGGCLQDLHALQCAPLSVQEPHAYVWQSSWQISRRNYLGIYFLLLKLQDSTKRLEPLTRLNDKRGLTQLLRRALATREKIGRILEVDYKGCTLCGETCCEHTFKVRECKCRNPLLCLCGTYVRHRDATEEANADNSPEMQEAKRMTRTALREICKENFLEISGVVGMLWLHTRNNSFLETVHSKICMMRARYNIANYRDKNAVYYCFKPFSRKDYVGKTEQGFYTRVTGHYRKAGNNICERGMRITSDVKEYGPSAFIFLRVFTIGAQASPTQLDLLESECIEWLQPSKNSQKKYRKGLGEAWGICKQVVTKGRMHAMSGPMMFRRDGRRSRRQLRGRIIDRGGIPEPITRIDAILAGGMTRGAHLVYCFTRPQPPDYAIAQIANDERRYRRVKLLGARLLEGNRSDLKEFGKALEEARRTGPVRDELRTQLKVHYPHLNEAEERGLRDIVRGEVYDMQMTENVLRILLRKQTSENFKSKYSNCRKVCRREYMSERNGCYCWMAPEEWKIQGHVCAKVSRIEETPGWNKNSRYHPTREEVEKQIEGATAALVRRCAAFYGVFNEERMAMRARNLLQESAFRQSEGYREASKGRIRKNEDVEWWLRKALVVGEVDKKTQECSAVCRYVYKEREKRYIAENGFESVPSFEWYEGQLVVAGGPGVSFFDNRWEAGRGHLLRVSTSRHQHPNSFLLIKNKNFDKAEAGEELDVHNLAVRPCASFSGHRYLLIYRCVARIIDHINQRLHGYETTTVRAMIQRIDDFNHNCDNEDASELSKTYKDVKNFFGSVPCTDIRRVLEEAIDELWLQGFRYALVPKERTAAATNRNYNEIHNYKGVRGTARPSKNRKGVRLETVAPRGRLKRTHEVFTLMEILPIVGHSFRWNLFHMGKKVWKSKVPPMGNPISPSGCCLWAADAEKHWRMGLTPRARAEEGKSWTRVRGVDDVFLVTGKRFEQCLDQVEREAVMRSVAEDFYPQGVILEPGKEGEHFGMEVQTTLSGKVALSQRKADVSRLQNGGAFNAKQKSKAIAHFCRILDFSNREGREINLVQKMHQAALDMLSMNYTKRIIRDSWQEVASKLNYRERANFGDRLLAPDFLF